MARSRIAQALAAVAVVTVGVVVAAQTYKSSINLVVLRVAVTDANDHFVGGLSRDDFSVFEDREARPIEQFSGAREPVSLGILVDVSGSMEGHRFADAQQAIAKLLERFHDDDQMFLGVFNQTFTMLVPWTSDHAAITGSLSGVKPRGGTFLYSTISAVLPIVNQGANRKKALVILSDGDDNEKMAGMNKPLLDRAVQQAQQSDTLIYLIGIGTPKPSPGEWLTLNQEARLRLLYDPPVDVDLMRQLTDPTGGYTQLVSASADLPSTVISIADDLSAQYTIGFESQHADNLFHELSVTMRNPAYRVRARTGYMKQ